MTGAEPEPIARRLMAERGGFWDVYFLGTAFSYAVYCSEYVELASELWNVLLCREAEDSEALHCGAAGLTLYRNGTLQPSGDGQRMAIKPSLYANYLVEPDEKPAAEAERMPQVVTELKLRTFAERARAPCLRCPA